MKIITTILAICFCSVLSGQQLKMDSVKIVSRANDTVEAFKGSFMVKENRMKSNSDSIEIGFIRLKSTNPNPGSPIVYLSGGPGGSGSNTLSGRRFQLFMKLRAVADVIAFDQRGTGLSHRLPRCPYRAEYALDKPVSKAEYFTKSTENINKCLQFWEDENVDLSAYNTTESAKDIEALRIALDVEKLSLWGISYGSHLAFEYIRLFENRIDKLVLASLEGPDETIKLPQQTQDFLFNIADIAKSNYGSENTYLGLRQKMIAVHERLKKQPATGSFTDRDGKTVSVKFSNFELQSAISTFHLKNPEDSKDIPRIYNEMYEADFNSVSADVWVVKKYIYSSVSPMSFSMDMQSGISNERKTIVNQQIDNSILGSTINFLLFEWMENLNYPMLPEAFRTMKNNQVDALLLSGTLDGRTYVESAKAIAKHFENGQHVIIKNAGHDLYMSSPLIESMVFDFFQGKELNVKSVELKPNKFE
jgi:pimeloyl-ACP methyl ester carboxylesterase